MVSVLKLLVLFTPCHEVFCVLVQVLLWCYLNHTSTKPTHHINRRSMDCHQMPAFSHTLTLNQLVQLWFNLDQFKLLFWCVSPKLSQLGHQLTELQLGNKLNSSFRFTNVRHIKSDLSQLTDDHAFSLAELPLVRFEINCCHGNTNRL